MLVCIDHGNKQIKTTSRTFTSGLMESDTRPPFGDNIMFYNGKYYTLSDQRIPYIRDKTEDDRFFILTLFAIAYEINAAGRYAPDQLMDIQLAVGLPPAHYGTQYKRFAQYFLDRGMIGFEFNGKVYSICITEAICFPQALAATAPVFKQLQLGTVAKAIVIDIGGFTADYLSLRYGAADWVSCDSLENGIITLYNRLLSKIRADYDLLLEETDIDAILTGRSTEYGSEIQALVERGAESFVADLFRTLRERKIELRTGKVIFVGGGSLLLRKQIENSGKIGTAIFVEEIGANAAGYGSYTRPQKQIGEQYGREERRLPIHGAIQCRRPKPPASSCYSERTGAAQGTVPCQCRDTLYKLSGVTGSRSCAQDRPTDSGTVGA